MATILYVTSDNSPQSGALKSLIYMSQMIINRGHRSILVLCDNPKNPINTTENPVKTYFLGLPQVKRNTSPIYLAMFLFKNIVSICKIYTIIRQEKVEIVHVNEILDVYAALAAKIAGVPCIWHIRADISLPWPFNSILAQLVVSLANVVVVVSHSVNECMFKRSGVDAKNVLVIHNPGPDPSRFHPGRNSSSIRSEFGIKDDEKLVVLVSKLVDCKGHSVLIRAVPHILKNFPNTRFLIVGGEVDGKHNRIYARNIRVFPTELGISKYITFTGYRTDVPQVIAAADVIVHCPTYPDPFPGVVLQGMAMGKPVVASAIGGVVEQIQDNVSGILVEPNDPDHLAQAVSSLLGNEILCDSLGRNAIHRVNTIFTNEIFFEKIARLYKTILVEKSSSKFRINSQKR